MGISQILLVYLRKIKIAVVSEIKVKSFVCFIFLFVVVVVFCCFNDTIRVYWFINYWLLIVSIW